MKLLIAANYVDGTDILVGEPNDGSGFGHLQIVYDPGNGGALTELVVQSQGSQAIFGNWEIEDEQSHADNTNYYGQPNYYSIHEIDLDGRSADQVWNILNQVREQFQNAQTSDRFEYDLDYNSNTYVNTLMSVVGIYSTDAQFYLETLAMNSFPGGNRNALDDQTYPNDAIDLTLFGTDGDDIIRTGNGDDTLIGYKAPDGPRDPDFRNGSDELHGGNGDDTLIGSQLGATLEGQDNADHAADRLEGGKGDDTYYVSADGLYFFGAADQPQPEPLLDNLDIIHDSDDTGTVYAQMHGNVTGNPFTRAYTSLNMY